MLDAHVKNFLSVTNYMSPVADSISRMKPTLKLQVEKSADARLNDA